MNEAGQVVNLDISKNSHPEIKSLLSDLIGSTAGNWTPRSVNGINSISKPFLLPLIYLESSGCKPTTDSNQLMIREVLDFEDTISFPLNCIVLNPVTILPKIE